MEDTSARKTAIKSCMGQLSTLGQDAASIWNRGSRAAKGQLTDWIRHFSVFLLAQRPSYDATKVNVLLNQQVQSFEGDKKWRYRK